MAREGTPNWFKLDVPSEIFWFTQHIMLSGNSPCWKTVNRGTIHRPCSMMWVLLSHVLPFSFFFAIQVYLKQKQNFGSEAYSRFPYIPINAPCHPLHLSSTRLSHYLAMLQVPVVWITPRPHQQQPSTSVRPSGWPWQILLDVSTHQFLSFEGENKTVPCHVPVRFTD